MILSENSSGMFHSIQTTITLSTMVIVSSQDIEELGSIPTKENRKLKNRYSALFNRNFQ
jgi:hypothetical protein